jgi:ubiquinone/menaquinone biosynthesis C-methylase UbiE
MTPRPVCPACGGDLFRAEDSYECPGCSRSYPNVAGLPDLRLRSDRYLDLGAERAKAGRLHLVERRPGATVSDVANAYYAMTDDVLDHRRERFLRHIAGAEARGAALAGRLPGRGAILDVGCGTGGLLVAAAAAGRAVVGVDIASRWLVVARRRLADRGLSPPLIAAEAERLPWPDASFDTVAADSLLEHLDDPGLALAEFRRVLRPGGTLVVWSPNRFTLATDPHLGLWGVGWLPRAWLLGYLRLRGRDDWPPRTLSGAQARRLARAAGFARVAVAPPPIPRGWARSRPAAERAAIGLYTAGRAFPGFREALNAVGPLWELRAEAPGRPREPLSPVRRQASPAGRGRG